MVKARVAPMVGVLFIAAFVAGACSSSTSSSSSSSASATTAVVASKAAFCADNDKLNAAFSNATGATIVDAIKTNIATVDDFGKVAPPEISADAQVLVTASHDAVASNDSAKLKTNAVQSAGTHVDTFCGSGSTTTTAPGADSTTSTTA